ncbi:hypothetical protein J2X17_001030 [Flavobacterium aquidurense]|nr:hypothetical protein [Flavobacterium aquidurense]
MGKKNIPSILFITIQAYFLHKDYNGSWDFQNIAMKGSVAPVRIKYMNLGDLKVNTPTYRMI